MPLRNDICKKVCYLSIHNESFFHRVLISTVSDVFLRHMRNCQKDQTDDLRRTANKFKSRTKKKRACDSCAKSKARCDYQIPCERCHRKSLKCEKSRKGYEDPYAMYSITTPANADIELEPLMQSGKDGNMAANPSYVEAPPAEVNVRSPETECLGQSETFYQRQQEEEVNSMALACSASPAGDESVGAFLNSNPLFTGFDIPASETVNSMHPDPASIYFASIGNLEQLFDPLSHSRAFQGKSRGIGGFYRC